MEFLEIKFYDDDIFKLLVRFGINFLFLVVTVRMIYYRITQRSPYTFTFFMVSILIFLICFTLKKFELELGMALGLFAVFGILRYRTDSIPIREMTYLFIVIGMAVVNSLANKNMSYTELIFSNGVVILVLLLLENGSFLNRNVRKTILYEKIDLIRPENREALVADLAERTGLIIARVEIGQIDFLRDTAKISIYYDPALQVTNAKVSVAHQEDQYAGTFQQNGES